MNPADKVEVVKTTLLPSTSGGSLKAFSNVRIGAIVINGFRVIEKDGGRAWVGAPQREVLQNGEKKYYPIIEINSRELKRLIDEKVLQSWRARVIAGEDHQPEQDEIPF
jgi:hypothetical protein